jgi:hypothetical protein
MELAIAVGSELSARLSFQSALPAILMFQNTNRGQGGGVKISRFYLNLRQVIGSNRGKELVQVTVTTTPTAFFFHNPSF